MKNEMSILTAYLNYVDHVKNKRDGVQKLIECNKKLNRYYCSRCGSQDFIIFECLQEDIRKLKLTQQFHPYLILEIVERRLYSKKFKTNIIFSLINS